jgi:hypothetical protein
MNTRVLIPLTVTVAAAFVAVLAPRAPALNANDVLPHQYVATLNAQQGIPRTDSRGLAVFRATLDQRPHVHDATRPFKPGDPLVWRIAFTRLSGQVESITLNAGAPGHRGQALRTICSPCIGGAHGTLSLNGRLAIALDQAPICLIQSPCSVAEPELFAVYVEINTARHPQGEIRGQLRFCSTTPTYNQHGSCSPPGYPALKERSN